MLDIGSDEGGCTEDAGDASVEDPDATIVYNANESPPCFELPFALENFMDINGFDLNDVAEALRAISANRGKAKGGCEANVARPADCNPEQ